MGRSVNLLNLAGKVFDRWTVLARAGSEDSGEAVWLCQCACGARKFVRGTDLTNGRSKSCGCIRRDWAAERSGEDSTAWKSGRYVRKDGRVRVRIDKKTVYEHRAVMEAHLGRPLERGEQVRHRNKDWADNRIENLRLIQRKETTNDKQVIR